MHERRDRTLGVAIPTVLHFHSQRSSHLKIATKFQPNTHTIPNLFRADSLVSTLDVQLSNSGNAPATDIELRMVAGESWFAEVSGWEDLIVVTDDGREERIGRERHYIKGRPNVQIVRLRKLLPNTTITFLVLVGRHESQEALAPSYTCTDDGGPAEKIGPQE